MWGYSSTVERYPCKVEVESSSLFISTSDVRKKLALIDAANQDLLMEQKEVMMTADKLHRTSGKVKTSWIEIDTLHIGFWSINYGKKRFRNPAAPATRFGL